MEKKGRARQLLVERSNRTIVQLIRYGLVAVVALAFDFGTYALLVRVAGIHPVLAATVGFTLGLLVNYVLSIMWVFKDRVRSRRVEVIAFFVIGLIGLGMTDIIIWLLAIEWHGDELIAKLAAAAIVFFWNFGARKVLLFKSVSDAAPQETM